MPTKYTKKKGIGKDSSAVENVIRYDPARHPRIAFGLCADFGFDDKRLADTFGINEYEIQEWKRLYPEFIQSVHAGRDDYSCKLAEDTLLKTALGYEYEEVKKKRIPVETKNGKKQNRLTVV